LTGRFIVPEKADFNINNLTFEVEDKNKTQEQT
jgi:hypothetical protein